MSDSIVRDDSARKPLTFLSLFAGIGGLDLGLERAGMKCIGQVEIDDYCRRVLAKHWPDVRRHDDVRTFPPKGDWSCDLICGGFPCQDISNAGKRAGIDGERSGLWSEFARIVRVVRPQLVLVENVAALLQRGLGRVVGDLATLGYDAEWDCIPAAAVGAPHLRDRLFIVAYARSMDEFPVGESAGQPQEMVREQHAASPGQRSAADAASVQRQTVIRMQPNGNHPGNGDVPNAGQPRLPTPQQEILRRARRGQEGGAVAECGWWAVEPDVGRVANGVSSRVDRLKGLGNAVVPQVAEWIGRRIMTAARTA